MRPHEVAVRLSEEEFDAIEKARKGATPAEYIRRLIMTAHSSTAIDPKYVSELESENACLVRSNTELREKLQAAEMKGAMTDQDADELRRTLTDVQIERDNLKDSVRVLAIELAKERARADAYELCLACAQIIPMPRPAYQRTTWGDNGGERNG